MGYGTFISIDASYPSRMIAEARLSALNKVVDCTHVKLQDGMNYGHIVGHVSGETKDLGAEMERIAEVLKPECDEGYLDGYIHNHTIYLNPDQ